MEFPKGAAAGGTAFAGSTVAVGGAIIGAGGVLVVGATEEVTGGAGVVLWFGEGAMVG